MEAPQDDPKTTMQESGTPNTLESLYLSAGLFIAGHTARRIRLIFGKQDSAKLVLDPNTCTLDAYGDPVGGTRIAARTIDVKLAPMQEEGQRKLVNLKGEGLSRPALRLVIVGNGDKPETARLLVLGEEEKITAIVPLQVVADPPQDAS